MCHRQLSGPPFSCPQRQPPVPQHGPQEEGRRKSGQPYLFGSRRAGGHVCTKTPPCRVQSKTGKSRPGRKGRRGKVGRGARRSRGGKERQRWVWTETRVAGEGSGTGETDGLLDTVSGQNKRLFTNRWKSGRDTGLPPAPFSLYAIITVYFVLTRSKNPAASSRPLNKLGIAALGRPGCRRPSPPTPSSWRSPPRRLRLYLLRAHCLCPLQEWGVGTSPHAGV